MTSNAKDILSHAMTLSVNDRADLAARLIESLDGEPEKDVEAAWDAEIARRIQEIDSGKVRPITMAEFWRGMKERAGHEIKGTSGRRRGGRGRVPLVSRAKSRRSRSIRERT